MITRRRDAVIEQDEDKRDEKKERRDGERMYPVVSGQ